MRAFTTFITYLLIAVFTSAESWANGVEKAYRWNEDPRYQLYKTGQHYRFETKKNLDKSLNYHLQAARADYAVSQYAVGYIMGFDKDRDPDYAQSLFWMLKVIGNHETPQIPKYQNLKLEAGKALKKLCKKGVVDFPDTHHLAKDSYCWLKRGNKLFYGRDKLGELFGGTKHGVNQDFVKARLYLEKAYAAGEKKASINLAKIYGKGLGVDASPEKYQKYVTVAAELGDSKTHLSLAQKAKKDGRIADYIQHLEVAAKTKMPSGSRASRKLGNIYFYDELIPADYEKAFMHFFLGGKTRYVRGDKATLPGFHTDMLLAMKNPSLFETLEAAKIAADDFAKTHKFRKSRKRKIDRAYGSALYNFKYVQRTGGEWYKDGRWRLYYLILILFGISMSVHVYYGYMQSKSELE